MPVFRETLLTVIPMVSSAGVRRVHIWGVIYPPALGALLWLCNLYGVAVSTDSVGPSIRPAFGVWGYMGWIDKFYKRPPVSIRGLEHTRHVNAVRQWLNQFEKTPFYKEPVLPKAKQLALF